MLIEKEFYHICFQYKLKNNIFLLYKTLFSNEFAIKTVSHR